MKSVRRVSTFGMMTWLFTASVLACPVCFRFEESRTTHGVQAGVLVLVGVTAVVLAGFAVFVAGFVRRSRGLP